MLTSDPGAIPTVGLISLLQSLVFSRLALPLASLTLRTPLTVGFPPCSAWVKHAEWLPAGQNIYLDVARPRALVVIDKATKEAGELTDKVRTFIAENLDLKTEVPALEIRADGTLVGGQVNGKDIFAGLDKENGPNVLVGPDSNPTLSFTSGSEGKPKGVLGRHYSLAYYFDWMAERFNLSDKDKFTMLSGIGMWKPFRSKMLICINT